MRYLRHEQKRREKGARHEFRFHHCSDLVVTLAPLTEKRIDLIYEDDTRLRLPCQTE